MPKAFRSPETFYDGSKRQNATEYCDKLVSAPFLFLSEREGRNDLARKKSKGTQLEVFSGKKEGLNRVILRILEWKSPLIAYDVWRQIKATKGFKNVDSKTAYRRMEELEREGLIAEKGTRVGKRGGDKILYELALRGKAALRLDEKSLEEFLKTATDEQLSKFLDSFY